MRKLIVLAVVWGWSFFFMKIALEGLTPSALVLGRLVFGAAVVVLSLVVTRTGLPRDLELWKRVSFMALVTNVAPFTLFAWAQERITSALASVLNASTALFAALVALAFLGERLRRAQVFGLLLGFLGVGVAAGVGSGDVAGSSLTGTAAGLGAAFCYAIGFAYSQRHHLGNRPEATTAGQLLIGAAVMAPFGIGTSIAEGLSLTPTRFMAVLVLGVLGTGVGYLIYYRMVAEVGATKASIVTYLVPVVGLVVGVTVADEPFSWRLVVGGLLIVGGVIAVQGNVPTWMKRKAPAVLAALAALGGVGLGGCATSEPEAQDTTTSSTAPSSDEGCGTVVEEQLDPQSGRHLLPDAPVPAYLSDPPTSGAHRSGGAPPSGVLSEPIDPPTQVQILESGRVLIQFASGQVTPVEVEQLEKLAAANDKVVVAPHDALPAPVVATAWVHKMLCEDVDANALAAFAGSYTVKAPGEH